MANARDELCEVVKTYGLRRLDAPVVLASGEESRDFVDGKQALARGRHLKLACEALLALVRGAEVTFDAVGGLTMGADQFAHGLALHLGDDTQWFVIRKSPKGRGTNKLVEGAQLGPGTRVLLVDDVVTTGGSIQQAHDAVVATGAEVVMAATLVDRGEVARRVFADLGIPYASVLTYRDLGIDPVGPGPPQATAGG